MKVEKTRLVQAIDFIRMLIEGPAESFKEVPIVAQV